MAIWTCSSLEFVTVVDCTAMPLPGVNCTDAGEEKFTPVIFRITEEPCVPCKGENSRTADTATGGALQPALATAAKQF